MCPGFQGRKELLLLQQLAKTSWGIRHTLYGEVSGGHKHQGRLRTPRLQDSWSPGLGSLRRPLPPGSCPGWAAWLESGGERPPSVHIEDGPRRVNLDAVWLLPGLSPGRHTAEPLGVSKGQPLPPQPPGQSCSHGDLSTFSLGIFESSGNSISGVTFCHAWLCPLIPTFWEIIGVFVKSCNLIFISHCFSVNEYSVKLPPLVTRRQGGQVQEHRGSGPVPTPVPPDQTEGACVPETRGRAAPAGHPREGWRPGARQVPKAQLPPRPPRTRCTEKKTTC